MSLFGLYFRRSMLCSSTEVAMRRFDRHLENLRTMTPLFNDIYFRSGVMSQLGGSTVIIILFCFSNAFRSIHRDSYLLTV